MSDLPVKWADQAMFQQDDRFDHDDSGGVIPKVTLLWMTPRPLSAIAAMAEMYKGNVVRNLSDITTEQKKQALADVQKTHLKAPLEAVKIQFLLEGVDRAFTHQLVRQRTAVYAQESMRFAVVEDLANGITLPPSLAGTEPTTDLERQYDRTYESRQQQLRAVWDDAIANIQHAYQTLVDAGMPQEDARGLLPHAVATRLHYITDLRNLSDHAGNRLCTQAQFVWRDVFTQIQNAIANYEKTMQWVEVPGVEDMSKDRKDWPKIPGRSTANEGRDVEAWETYELARANLFRPVCYQLGHCPFQASFDRACKIRDRVEAFSKAGVPSDNWSKPPTRLNIRPIADSEWRYDPAAAR